MLKKVNLKISYKKIRLINLNAKNFSIYIPQQKIRFINHHKYGIVYPVYIADKDFDRWKDPKKVVPFISLFSVFNIFVIFSGLSFVPTTNFYLTIYGQDLFLYGSLLGNIFAIKRYLNLSLEYKNRLHKMFLNSDGTTVKIVFFDGSEDKVQIDEIFESRIDNKYESFSKSYPIATTNHNSVKLSFSYGNGKEVFVSGRNFYCDWEIFKSIVNRKEIDTKTAKNQVKEHIMKWYDEQELRSVISYARDKNNVIYRKFYLDREISNLFKKRIQSSKEKQMRKLLKEKNYIKSNILI